MNISFLFSGSAMHGGKKKTFRSQAHIRKVTTEKKERLIGCLLYKRTKNANKMNKKKEKNKIEVEKLRNSTRIAHSFLKAMISFFENFTFSLCIDGGPALYYTGTNNKNYYILFVEVFFYFRCRT